MNTSVMKSLDRDAGVFTVQQHGNYIQNRRKKPNFIWMKKEKGLYNIENIRVKKLNAN